MALGAFDGTGSLEQMADPGELVEAQADALTLADRVLERSISNVPVALRDDWEYLRGQLDASRTAIVDGTFSEMRATIFDTRSARVMAELATYVEGLPCLPDDDLRPRPATDEPS